MNLVEFVYDLPVVVFDVDSRQEIYGPQHVRFWIFLRVELLDTLKLVIRRCDEGNHGNHDVEGDAGVCTNAATASKRGAKRLTLLVVHLGRGAQRVVISQESLHSNAQSIFNFLLILY